MEADDSIDVAVEVEPGTTRRELLERGAAVAAVAGAAALLPQAAQASPTAAAARAAKKPKGGMNVLVIMVDQMRHPALTMSDARFRRSMPNLSRLMAKSVRFDRHITASNACSPARSAFITGLYTHQTGMYITQELKEDGAFGGPSPDLNRGFPTYGSMLRTLGYDTPWIGKWHLSTTGDYEPYGFANMTFPSPNGGPGEGMTEDPNIATQFVDWIGARQQSDGPWCTTVSLVNPHDISFYPRWTRRTEGQDDPRKVFRRMPANFETPSQLLARKKPTSQRGLQQAEATAVGVMPWKGSRAVDAWTDMLDTYLLMHEQVDREIGRVIDALNKRPEIARNTIVLFTADHGEYAGAHGLRGKGAAVYEEAINVPFSVYDPSGTWTTATSRSRTQLTSSVDVAPLLMTLASGGDKWRSDSRWAHLRRRGRIERQLRDPRAAGRRYVVHATDEHWVEEGATFIHGDGGPPQITSVRTANGKYASYGFWKSGTVELQDAGAQSEAYDYAKRRGVLELDNLMRSARTRRDPLVKQLQELLFDEAMPNELDAPLPKALQPFRQQAIDDYLKYVAAQ
jgi:arylsulfatase A-like enzyme